MYIREVEATVQFGKDELRAMTASLAMYCKAPTEVSHNKGKTVKELQRENEEYRVRFELFKSFAGLAGMQPFYESKIKYFNKLLQKGDVE